MEIPLCLVIIGVEKDWNENVNELSSNFKIQRIINFFQQKVANAKRSTITIIWSKKLNRMDGTEDKYLFLFLICIISIKLTHIQTFT